DQQRLQVLLVGFVHVSVPRLWLSPIILNFYHSRDPFFREAIDVNIGNVLFISSVTFGLFLLLPFFVPDKDKEQKSVILLLLYS
ncbi:MAG: hypothetical protein ABSA01_16595, partial [Anaerolineales bacterium]